MPLRGSEIESLGAEGAPEETTPSEESGPFKKVQLRLLMKEREGVVLRLVELDYTIWTLEEFFRAGAGMMEPLPSSGTCVPEGSLSSVGRNLTS